MKPRQPAVRESDSMVPIPADSVGYAAVVAAQSGLCNNLRSDDYLGDKRGQENDVSETNLFLSLRRGFYFYLTITC